MFLALLGTSVLVFFMIHMIPGDPALLIAGLEAGPELWSKYAGISGLDQPLYQQYWSFLVGALHGDFGTSIRMRVPVLEEIFVRPVQRITKVSPRRHDVTEPVSQQSSARHLP